MSHQQEPREQEGAYAAVPDPSASSLFPAYAVTSSQQAAGWLQNASFIAMPAASKPAEGSTDQEARSKSRSLHI